LLLPSSSRFFGFSAAQCAVQEVGRVFQATEYLAGDIQRIQRIIL
jgi:hypothetical protein